MLRKCTDEDISDEECKNVIDPFYDNFDEYVVNYIMPEVIAFYIASSFYRNAMWEATFLQHSILLLMFLIYLMRIMKELKLKLLNYLE